MGDIYQIFVWVAWRLAVRYRWWRTWKLTRLLPLLPWETVLVASNFNLQPSSIAYKSCPSEAVVSQRLPDILKDLCFVLWPIFTSEALLKVLHLNCLLASSVMVWPFRPSVVESCGAWTAVLCGCFGSINVNLSAYFGFWEPIDRLPEELAGQSLL